MFFFYLSFLIISNYQPFTGAALQVALEQGWLFHELPLHCWAKQEFLWTSRYSVSMTSSYICFKFEAGLTEELLKNGIIF